MAQLAPIPGDTDQVDPAAVVANLDGPDGGAALTDSEFSAAVAAVTSAFGDPTRRQIYLFVRDRAGGVTASDVAAHFGLHANVARHHLDKLSAGGYVEVFVHRPGSPDAAAKGAGRPSKRYRASAARATGLGVPHRTDDLLIVLLGRALALVPVAEAESMAESVGEEYGRRLASQMSCGEGQRSFRAALHAIAEALTAHGFAAHAEARGGGLALIKDTCPFFDTAKSNPVVCAVDRGMVKGMLAGLYGEAVPASESSRALGDAACVTVV
ncbi:helix-turn-helix domain-containing protein [Acidiferrimicrobium sp. IK]|uniref:helix-turn-helix transcriptional regulator n=1 Tax=Acidiferrimicrobium sp. IK TaxID=2871700 RepID=UPI0021CB61F4|nr:helix-turn-helix domain-containing protein [Acidiferrimicrobium sp. IK]MCU4185842.1 helix-turn-helix domain-containing protein [Acidiferrimicrobium sp. IK]